MDKSRQDLKWSISFSLYGRDYKYLQGALENTILCRAIYPEWAIVFYLGQDVPAEFVRELRYRADYVTYSPPWIIGRLARYLINDLHGVARYLVRDVDSRVNLRERDAVEAWLQSGKPYHVMRDKPQHSKPIMAGMFGGTPGFFSISDLASKYRFAQHGKLEDEMLLKEKIWPLIEEKVLIHDSREDGGGEGFPHRRRPGEWEVGKIHKV